MPRAWKSFLCALLGHKYAKVANPPCIDAGPYCEFAKCIRCRELFVLNHDAKVVLEFWRVAHLYREREEWRKRRTRAEFEYTTNDETRG